MLGPPRAGRVNPRGGENCRLRVHFISGYKVHQGTVEPIVVSSDHEADFQHEGGKEKMEEVLLPVLKSYSLQRRR